MESKRRKSLLRRSVAVDSNVKTLVKRRISFSGKNSVREFYGEEEPKTWNDCYEISDHLNVNETASNLSIKNVTRSNFKNNNENKENMGETMLEHEFAITANSNQIKKNLSSGNNPVLNTTQDFINISNQNSKISLNETSVDITLHDRELQVQADKRKKFEQSINIKKEARSIMFGERTMDYELDLTGNAYHSTAVVNTVDFKDNENIKEISENMHEGQFLDFTRCKSKNPKESIQQTTVIQLSPRKTKQFDKEIGNPIYITNKNETQNNSCKMEITDEPFSEPQISEFNVEKESQAFQEKLNQLSFLQKSDENVQLNKSHHDLETNVKTRQPTSNFNEAIEMSPNYCNLNIRSPKDKINSHTILFNQTIEISPGTNNKNSDTDECTSKIISRPTVYFNTPIEVSSNIDNKKSIDSRQTINFNQSIEVDTQATKDSKYMRQGAIPKGKLLQTINFNQHNETNLHEPQTHSSRQTINLNEDMCVSPKKLYQESTSGTLNVADSVVFRKLCTPFLNTAKTPIDWEEEKMQELNDKSKTDSCVAIDTEKTTIDDKSFLFPLSSVKNMSLPPEFSSPLIPPEFKAFNLRQLNDEIERGKINVFPNAPKTPNDDRKNRLAVFISHSKNSLSQTSCNQRRTLAFEDDDGMMLDNTSFLTRAKLSDETVSRNCSKKEITQHNNDTLFFDALREEASKLEDYAAYVYKVKKASSTKDDNLESSMFQNNKPITSIGNSNNFRSLYDTTADIVNEFESSRSSKSVYKAQDMDVSVNELTSECRDKTDFSCLNIEELMDFSVAGLNGNNINNNTYNSDKIKSDRERKSIYSVECMDLTLDGEKNEEFLKKENNVELAIDNETDVDLSKEPKNNHLQNENRKTLIFNNSNEMSLDESFTAGENYQFLEPEEPLNAAKMALARRNTTNKSKLTNNKKENVMTTPVKLCDSNSNMFYLTPRLSLLEFKAQELLQNSKCPLGMENTHKRLSHNLTPLLLIPKKRQTLVFDDCVMDESEVLPLDENSVENISVSHKDISTMDVEEPRNKEDIFCPTKHLIEISGIKANDSELQTPLKHIQSRIPIPINTEKNKSLVVLETTKDRETEFLEGDNLAESIQLMRKATSLAQKSDTLKGPSIFESNPITISDVSVFFETQKKSNSLVIRPDMSLALDKENICGINATEMAKKSSDNCYLNLSLEDIDKTRLSLVQISYEDGGEHKPVTDPVDNCIDDMSPLNNCEVLKNKSCTVNNLRNFSAVCRKCKRCQDTILNETSSSSFESFVLPPIPPLPDVGLDRLRRLRKRPTVEDVHVLWQRVSLNRTIINPVDISVDDIQIDGEVNEESNCINKIIRKYEKDMLNFEMDLQSKQDRKAHSAKLPFVLRLDALLSTNSKNWIFDFQMQHRGILLFTYKHLLTFAVSLKFDEIDPLGHEIIVKSVEPQRRHVPEKNWKPIDFALAFQLKLNLPFDLKMLCEDGSEFGILKMLQAIDRICVDTIKMGNKLQRISFANQASIIRDEFGVYVRKNIRKIVNRTGTDFKDVEKIEIIVQLLNLKNLNFRDIVSPPLHCFREDVHLLPTGLDFLQEFLPNPCSYMKQN